MRLYFFEIVKFVGRTCGNAYLAAIIAPDGNAVFPFGIRSDLEFIGGILFKSLDGIRTFRFADSRTRLDPIGTAFAVNSVTCCVFYGFSFYRDLIGINISFSDCDFCRLCRIGIGIYSFTLRRIISFTVYLFISKNIETVFSVCSAL